MQWIDEQLKARGMTRRELASVIPGMTETKMSLVMGKRRKLSADEADAIRRYFGYRLPHDPVDPSTAQIYDLLARLGEGQKRAVALYLEALAENAPSRSEVSQ